MGTVYGSPASVTHREASRWSSTRFEAVMKSVLVHWMVPSWFMRATFELTPVIAAVVYTEPSVGLTAIPSTSFVANRSGRG